MVKSLPHNYGRQVNHLSGEDPLGKGVAIHSSILA